MVESLPGCSPDVAAIACTCPHFRSIKPCGKGVNSLEENPRGKNKELFNPKTVGTLGEENETCRYHSQHRSRLQSCLKSQLRWLPVVVRSSHGLLEGLLVSSTLDGSQEEVAVGHTDITPARL